MGGGHGGIPGLAPEEHHDEEMSPQDEALLRDSKISMLALVGFLTFASSMIPWLLTRAFRQRALNIMHHCSAAAAGVILGAFLCHMVPNVTVTFMSYMLEHHGAEDPKTTYPWGMMIIGAVFIMLIALDRLALHMAGGHSDVHGHVHGSHEAHDHITASLQQYQQERNKEMQAAEKQTSSPADTEAKSDAIQPKEPASQSPEENAPVADKDANLEQASKTTDVTLQSTDATKEHEAIQVALQPAAVDKAAGARALVFILALCLHAFFDGLALGAEDTLDGFYGILVAVLAHKVFDGIAAGASVYPAHLPAAQALGLIILAASMTPIGIAVGYGATEAASSESSELASAIIVSMSAGSFLFISITELLPASLHDGRNAASKLLAFFLGWAGMTILAGYV